MQKRRYSDQEKGVALAMLDACKGNYKETHRRTGIPWTTLRDWERNEGVTENVADIRSTARSPLLDRLRQKVDEIVDAIGEETIAAATLPQLAVAAGKLLDKIAALEKAAGLTPADLEAERQRLADILLRYITDDDLLARIAAEMDGSAEPASPGGAVRPSHSDEGPAPRSV